MLLPSISGNDPTTHPARAAALLLGLCGPNSYVDDGGGRVIINDSQGTYVSVLTTRAAKEPAVAAQLAAAARIASLRLDADHLSFAALADDAVMSASSALRLLGRAVTARIPCAILQLSEAKWATIVGRHGNIHVPLALDDVARDVQLPEGYVLGLLDPSEASVCASTWAYSNASAVSMFSTTIAQLPSACIRHEGSGELAAWILMRYDGSLGVLFTQPQHRGRGLARAVMHLALIRLARWRSRLLCLDPLFQPSAPITDDIPATRIDVSLTPRDVSALAALIVPQVHVVDGNVASTRLMESMGFEVVQPTRIGRATWVASASRAPRFVLRPIRARDDDEWGALVRLVNVSYRQDDAFFVDHPRTPHDGSELRSMGCTGTFFLGYRINEQVVGAPNGLGVDLGDPEPLPRDSALRPSFPSAAGGVDGSDRGGISTVPDEAKPAWESNELIVAFYIKLAPDEIHEGSTASGLVAGLSLLTISPELKRLGCAQRLLDASLHVAVNAGATSCDVYIVSVKPWLLNFYERNGFTVVGKADWPTEDLGQLLMPCYFHRARRQLQNAPNSSASK